jgi:hypothetical protein
LIGVALNPDDGKDQNGRLTLTRGQIHASGRLKQWRAYRKLNNDTHLNLFLVPVAVALQATLQPLRTGHG